MKWDGFLALLIVGAIIAAAVVFYLACGALMAAALHVMPWTVNWYACLLAWPAAVIVAAWLLGFVFPIVIAPFVILVGVVAALIGRK